MLRKSLKSLAVAAALGASGGLVWGGVAPAHAADEAYFGGADDVAFAAQLWRELAEARLVGPNALTSKPYVGGEPHGAILVTLQSDVTVGGHTGAVLVKNNYMGDTVSVASVANDPERNLVAVTVMFQRAAGYDTENQNWFWAKFSADGSLQANPKGMKLAGRVSKEPEGACIGCHKGAPGGDYVFLSDRLAR